MKIDRSITVGRPRAEVYEFWRAFENFPRFMQHLKSVQGMDSAGNRSHWVAKAPLDQQVEWDSEITSDRPNEMIAWHSLPGSQIENGGTVRFEDAPGNRGTEVHVFMAYEPPGGQGAALLARVLGEEPEKQIHDDLRHFKQIMEVGFVSTVYGQTSGRQDDVEKERAALSENKETIR
jgi:uncharacterized membrane protein